MKNIERIEKIFDQTSNLLKGIWVDEENDQMSHILNYLSLTACYLKSKEEAQAFQEKWNKVRDSIKKGSDQMGYLNQTHMLEAHITQALAEESVHNPKDNRNIGIAKFYENSFQKLYVQTEIAYKGFQEKQDKMVRNMQNHHEKVFSSHESWEAALARGDPMALVD